MPDDITMNAACRRATTAEHLAASMNIREAVFIHEQQVPVDLERDGMDDNCLHYLVEVDGKAMGTARVMLLADKFKFQRVAVLADARGTGLGSKLMRFIMNDLAQRNDAPNKMFFLSSQVSAIGFYERLGFAVCSEIFIDAGIEHRDMQRHLIYASIEQH